MKMAIDSVIIGERRREDMGDIPALAASLKRFGLLHPIVIDSERNLVAGGRRLEAARSLGWTEIEARDLGELSEAERREIELEENLRRKDLTPYEQSRILAERVGAIQEIIRQEQEVLPESGKTQGGRPAKAGVPLAAVADRIETPRATIQKAQQHVAAADAFPFMRSPEWKQYHVLEAAEALERLPEPERPAVAALINRPGIPPKDAIEMIANVAAKPAPERAKIIELAVSSDHRDRQLAITRAAAKPPMPDPRNTEIDHVLTLLAHAEKGLRVCAKTFPTDPLAERIRAVTTELKAIGAAIEALHEERISA